jgi:hypothetical protein
LPPFYRSSSPFMTCVHQKSWALHLSASLPGKGGERRTHARVPLLSSASGPRNS